MNRVHADPKRTPKHVKSWSLTESAWVPNGLDFLVHVYTNVHAYLLAITYGDLIPDWPSHLAATPFTLRLYKKSLPPLSTHYVTSSLLVIRHLIPTTTGVTFGVTSLDAYMDWSLKNTITHRLFCRQKFCPTKLPPRSCLSSCLIFLKQNRR